MDLMKKAVKYAGILVLIWFSIHILYTIIDGILDKNGKADLAVVFGNKVNVDGSLSNRLKARLDQGITLYNKGRVQKLLVSGGLGKEGFWEGSEMKKYLMKNKIPGKNIIVDNYGDDTEKTVLNSIRIADSLHYNTMISVSQYYHQSRIKRLYKRNSFENIQSSSPEYFELRDFYSIFREFIAFYFD